jgi:hypothetical protein
MFAQAGCDTISCSPFPGSCWLALCTLTDERNFGTMVHELFSFLCTREYMYIRDVSANYNSYNFILGS